MPAPQRLAASAAFILALLLPACASPDRIDAARLPLGQWEGTGVFVASPDHVVDTPSATFARRYDTSCTIEEVMHDGAAALRMTILSKNEGLEENPDPDMSAHIVLVMKDSAAVSPHARLYQLMASGVSEDGSVPELEVPDNPVFASVMRDENDLVLQVIYAPGFVDTFVFDDDTLEKFGTYYPDAEANPSEFVHWTEMLERVD